ncbi:MAG TPA: LysE family translocator [Steroidobacter sp.]|uniref:LysE family translocator n=1 Tax=Steroidobacter sp. TaxID=1978227 RepID=UPI002ED814BD
MEALIAGASLIAVAAITPGPNNLAVLRITVAHGMPAAFPAMAGIVLGGLAMLGMTQLGLAALVEEHSWVRSAIAVCGGTYLAWLGLTLVWRGLQRAPDAGRPEKVVPDGALAMFVFQFTNPKSWTLALTVSAAMPAADDAGRFATTAMLFALFVAIPSACLIAWAAFGRLAARMLKDAAARARFDCAMGVALAASAIALLVKR